MRRWTRAFSRALRGLALALFAASFAGGAAWGQGEGLRLASPREVMQTFLDSMVAYRTQGHERFLDKAVAAFEQPGAETPELARQLYGALNRVEYVRYESIPGVGDAALEGGRVRHVFGPPPSDSEALVEIEFVRLGEAGWRISSATAAAIPATWERVQHLQLIDELPLLSRLHVRIRDAVPAALKKRVFVIEGWQWIGLLLLAFAAAVLDRVARVLAAIALRRLARGERLDEESVAGFGRPIGLLAAALVFAGALPILDLEPEILGPLDIAAAFVAAVAGVWAAYRLVDVLCGFLQARAARTASKFDDVMVPLLSRTLKLFVAILGGVYLASKWTDDLWGIVAGLGVGSIAIAFAGRDTIENLFGTFTVLLDKPFELADYVVVGGIEGTVEDVGFRSTRIRTIKDTLVTVPNRTFVTSDVENFGRRRWRLLRTALALTYDTPPEKIEAFCAGVRALIQAHPHTHKDGYFVYLHEMNAHSLDVLLQVGLEVPDRGTELRERHRLLADVLRLAERLNVGFAFPTQTLHVAKPEDLEHPDRPASDGAGGAHGRAIAKAIAAESLRSLGGPGALPPLLQDPADPHARGSVTEAGR
jgi:MscS family membrane protein